MKALLIGFGNVGQATYEVLKAKMPEIEIIGITNSKGTWPNLIPSKTYNMEEIENLPDFRKGMDGISALKELRPDILIETTPTNIQTGEPGLSHIEYALKNEIDVVTSNKGPLAINFPKLMKIH